jgi:hypothetical protein
MSIPILVQCYLAVQGFQNNRMLPSHNVHTHPITILSGSIAVQVFQNNRMLQSHNVHTRLGTMLSGSTAIQVIHDNKLLPSNDSKFSFPLNKFTTHSRNNRMEIYCSAFYL